MASYVRMGTEGTLILSGIPICCHFLSGDAHARRPLHKIHGVLFCFFVFYVSCWNIRFRAICHFRPTNSASSGENLSNCVHLFRQLWIFETIFSPPFSRFRKRSPSIPVISLSASLCSARKLIKYSKPNAVRARRNAFMRDFPGVTNLWNYGPRNLWNLRNPRNLRNLTKITYFDRNIYFERIFNNDVSKQLSLVINLWINS